MNLENRKPNYDRFPAVHVKGFDKEAFSSYDFILKFIERKEN